MVSEIQIPVGVGGIELADYGADGRILRNGQVTGIDIAGRAVAGTRIPGVRIIRQFLRIGQPVPVNIIVVVVFRPVPVEILDLG